MDTDEIATNQWASESAFAVVQISGPGQLLGSANRNILPVRTDMRTLASELRPAWRGLVQQPLGHREHGLLATSDPVDAVRSSIIAYRWGERT